MTVAERVPKNGRNGTRGQNPGGTGGKWCRYKRAVGEMLLQGGHGSAAVGTRTHTIDGSTAHGRPHQPWQQPQERRPRSRIKGGRVDRPTPPGASMGSSRCGYCGEAKLIPSMHPHSPKRTMRGGSTGSLSMHPRVTSKPPSIVTLQDGPKSGQGVEGEGGEGGGGRAKRGREDGSLTATVEARKLEKS